MLVGPGVFVGLGRGVLVAGASAGVEVFGGAGVRKSRELGRCGFLGVALTMRVDVLVALAVADWVMVGVAEIRGVAVAVAVGVRVGNVEVGNGPRRASAVPMIAVLVLSTFDCSSNPLALVSRKISPNVTNSKPMHSRPSTRTYQWARFVFELIVAAFLSIPVFQS